MVGYRLVPPKRSFEDYYGHIGGGGLEIWHYAGCENCVALPAAGAPSINVIRAVPFIAPARGGVLDRLGFEVTAFVSGNARIGIYEANDETLVYPGALLIGTSDIATPSNGVKTATISQELRPGNLYWAAFNQSTASTIRILGVGNMSHLLGVPNTFGGTPGVMLQVAFAYAAMPATFPAGAAIQTAGNIPAIGLRYSG